LSWYKELVLSFDEKQPASCNFLKRIIYQQTAYTGQVKVFASNEAFKL